MNHTDTIELPRIVATSSTTPDSPRRPRWWLALAALLLIAAGAALAVIAGQAIAWRDSTPGPAQHVERLDLELPIGPLDGTDAGMITEPAGGDR